MEKADDGDPSHLVRGWPWLQGFFKKKFFFLPVACVVGRGAAERQPWR